MSETIALPFERTTERLCERSQTSWGYARVNGRETHCQKLRSAEAFAVFAVRVEMSATTIRRRVDDRLRKGQEKLNSNIINI